MKVTLSNWERFMLAQIIGSGQAPNIAQVRMGNKALDVVELSDEQKAEVGWQVLPGGQQVIWQQEKDWELEFDDDVWQLVQMYVRAFQRWPQDRRSETLYDKVMGSE